MMTKTKKVEILLNNGRKHIATVENYNAEEIMNKIVASEDKGQGLIAIGDVVVQRYNIISVVPIDEEKK